MSRRESEKLAKLREICSELADKLPGVDLDKLPAIESPYCEYNGPFSEPCAGFNYQGARYHIWLDSHTPGASWLHGKTLYKNAPLGIKYKESGYFKTRHLDSEKACNMLLIAALLLAIDFPAAKLAWEAKRMADDIARESEEREAQRLAGLQSLFTLALPTLKGASRAAESPIYADMVRAIGRYRFGEAWESFPDQESR